jgi:hydrogenase maturation protease
LNVSETLVIGVGNAYRGDDGAGIVAARKLAAQKLPGVRMMEMNGEGTSLVEAWKNSPSVLLVDAVSSGAVPGTIHRFEAQAGPLPTGLEHHSSHSFGVAEAVEVSRALGNLPPRLVIYGIEGKNFSPGRDLSPEVERAVEEVASRLVSELRSTI